MQGLAWRLLKRIRNLHKLYRLMIWLLLLPQTQIGRLEGLINICMPYLVLEPIMSKLTTTFWVASSIAKQAHPEQVDILEKKIKKTYVPLAVN